MTKETHDELKALNSKNHFGAFVLIIIGVGVLLFVMVSVVAQQGRSTTKSELGACENFLEITCDDLTDTSCQPQEVPSTPETLESPSQETYPSFAASATPYKSDLLLKPDTNLKYATYLVAPKDGSKIGTLSFSELDTSVPIVEGTSPSSLENGAGHFAESVLPGMKDNTVISGHRETYFNNLGKLEIGHNVIVTTIAGSFTYQVIGTRVVDADDRTIIVPTKEATLTMTTCYPFLPYGPKPQRYIVSAQLISSKLQNP